MSLQYTLLWGRYREFPKYLTNLEIIGQNSGLTLSSSADIYFEITWKYNLQTLPHIFDKAQIVFKYIHWIIPNVNCLQLHDGGFRSIFETVSFLTLVTKQYLHYIKHITLILAKICPVKIKYSLSTSKVIELLALLSLQISDPTQAGTLASP